MGQVVGVIVGTAPTISEDYRQELAEAGQKYCPRCDYIVPFSSFTKNKTNSDGLQIWCRDCYNGYLRGYSNADPDRAAKLAKKIFHTAYATIGGRATHLLNNARQRAKREKTECVLTKAWVASKLEAGVCEASGLGLKFYDRTGKGHRINSFAPSLDRVDPDGPYNESNVRMTSWIYNRARGRFGDDRLIRVFAGMSSPENIPVSTAIDCHRTAADLLSSVRSRAAASKIPFSLSRDSIQAKIATGRCAVTGIPFDNETLGPLQNGDAKSAYRPSMDRIDQTGPYSDDNVRATVWIYNRARGAFPDADLELLSKAMLDKLAKTRAQ